MQQLRLIEERELIAAEVGMILGITADEVLGLAALTQELAKRNITFRIYGPYASKFGHYCSTIEVYRMPDFERCIRYGDSDPLRGLLSAVKGMLKIPKEITEAKPSGWKRAARWLMKSWRKEKV